MTFNGKFEELPDEPPYGFWIAPDGSFTAVNYWGHISAIQQIMPDITLSNYVDIPQSKGFIIANQGTDIRVDPHTKKVYMGNDIIGWKYSHHQTTNKALKTLKDLAAFYHMPLYKCNFHN